MNTKECSACHKTKDASEFYVRSGSKSRHSACKSCERQMAKDWYENNRDAANQKVKEWREANAEKVQEYRAKNRQKSYRQELRRKHGVAVAWFDEQIAKQKNRCAVCSVQFAWGNKQTAPHVDHCHESKAVRGILCNRCNTVLGLSKDNESLLTAMIRYLRKSRKCHGSSAKR